MCLLVRVTSMVEMKKQDLDSGFIPAQGEGRGGARPPVAGRNGPLEQHRQADEGRAAA
jgi:hypothetical protein